MTIWHYFIPVVLLFSATTYDRAVHGLWALLFFFGALIVYAGIKKFSSDKSIVVKLAHRVTTPPGIKPMHATTMALFVLYLGSWIPDIDWLFNSHRNPFTHSALPLFAMIFLSREYPFGNPKWNKALLAVFAFGLGSHLWMDIPPGGNVVWVPAKLDYPFLFINGLICLIFGYRLVKQIISDSDVAPIEAATGD